MGCWSSKQIDDTIGGVGLTKPKPATNAASPETNISTARLDDSLRIALQRPDIGVFGSDVQVSLSTGTDVSRVEFSGEASGWAQTMRPPAADERRDRLSSASGKRSKRPDILDHAGQLKERTKPKFTGGFSDISQAKLGDRVVAVKELRLHKVEGDGDGLIWKQLEREVYVWAALDHPNVLELLGFAFEDGGPCLISPWCENGTLQDYLQKSPDATNRRQLVCDIAEGLRYLHVQMPPIIHGDLRTANVLVTGENVAKIKDFGCSRRVERFRPGFFNAGLALTTIRYSAPEILRDGQYSILSSDVFSFACVALETMTDKCPFWKIPNVVGVIAAVVFKKQTPSPEDHPGMDEASWELLRRCWNYEPSDRPYMADVCKMGAMWEGTGTDEAE
ncbi:hypothetical protein FRC00_001292 [Tulasnella sp. 408]|nr:hypothetical protein FRC00_001292 [Tulasnella sp. 408]